MPADGEILVKGALAGQSCGGEFAPRLARAGETVIRVRNLRKHYGDVEAVRGIDFDVERGEIFGLIGPDGAGKTSTFQILAGVMKATSGDGRGLRQAGARRALGNRLPDAGVQPLSRSHRDGKHSLHRRSALGPPERDHAARPALSRHVRHGPFATGWPRSSAAA